MKRLWQDRLQFVPQFDGETDKMVILVRSEGDTYECETGFGTFLKSPMG